MAPWLASLRLAVCVGGEDVNQRPGRHNPRNLGVGPDFPMIKTPRAPTVLGVGVLSARGPAPCRPLFSLHGHGLCVSSATRPCVCPTLWDLRVHPSGGAGPARLLGVGRTLSTRRVGSLLPPPSAVLPRGGGATLGAAEPCPSWRWGRPLGGAPLTHGACLSPQSKCTGTWASTRCGTCSSPSAG